VMIEARIRKSPICSYMISPALLCVAHENIGRQRSKNKYIRFLFNSTSLFPQIYNVWLNWNELIMLKKK